jgi:hypothetical protein
MTMQKIKRTNKIYYGYLRGRYNIEGSVSSPLTIKRVAGARPVVQESQCNSTMHLSRFSPGCQDFDPLGGIKPNILTIGDLHGVFVGSPELRRTLFNSGVPPHRPGFQELTSSSSSQGAQGMFDEMLCDSIMADIINNGGGHPSFTEQEAEAYGDKEEGDESWENGVYSYVGVFEWEVEDVAVANPKGKAKRTATVAVEPKKKVGGRGPK